MQPAGSRLGPYEIQSSIGAGGMGEVYRARDTRLDRIVAVKVIAGAAALDPSFRERFDREARAISALDHPNICTLYDVGHEDGTDFLVMQYLEGETLADRLARGARPKTDGSGVGASAVTSSTQSKGPLTVDLALRYGAEIAGALHAAHRRGIVHRDLKPGNIMLTKTGTRLLDFGLAKLAEQGAISGLADLATKTVPLTATGSIVGTLNYMAPEQLEGGAIDARTDIFAFGAVLFEMLNGRRAFDAQSHAGLIAAILNDDPPRLDDSASSRHGLPPSVHRALDRLMRKCLAKDPDDRWQSAADLGAELSWIQNELLLSAGRAEEGPSAAPPPIAAKRHDRLWKAIALAALLALGAGAAWWWSRPALPTEVLSFDIAEDLERVGPFFDGPAGSAISPDGQHIVIVIGAGVGSDPTRLVIRSMNSTEMVSLPGTEGASQPFWSPDSQSVGFVVSSGDQQRMLRIDRNGRSLTTICERSRGRGTWGTAGLILFGSPEGIWSVPENGGVPTLVTKVTGDEETGYHWPLFLPDGRRFLYMARHRGANREKNVIRLGSLDANTRQDILKANSSVELSASHLLFYREGTVFAQRFDTAAARLMGEPQPILEGIAYNPDNGRAGFSVAADADVLVFRKGRNISVHNTLEWFSLDGKPLGLLGGTISRNRAHTISPDGSRVAVMRDEPDGKMDIYEIDVSRNVTSRLISNPGDDMFPVWSPDGKRIYYTSSGRGSLDLTRRSLSSGASDEILVESADLKVPSSISRDEQVLLFTLSLNGLRFGRDIWALPLSGTRKPFPVVQTRYEEEEAVFSPDGKWIAYQSNDLGDWQVYVRSFPVKGQPVRISNTSGSAAAWSADGKTILYLSDGKVMSVDITFVGDGLRPATPRELFTPPGLGGDTRSLDLDPKSRRLLLSTRQGETAAASPPLRVLRGWLTRATGASAREH